MIKNMNSVIEKQCVRNVNDTLKNKYLKKIIIVIVNIFRNSNNQS